MQTEKRRPKRLKPAGHSATIEALIQPAIVVSSTLMSVIASYVLAHDEIARLLTGRGSWQDVFVVALCAGMGFLIDMAIIVSATRYKMHAVRGDPRERRWLQLATTVLTIGLVSEAMTLFYFFVTLDPAVYPSWVVALAGGVHAVLVSARAFLPPVVLAYFAAGVLPIAFDRADRNREIKTRTSSNVMTLIDRLSYVEDTDDKGEMLRALGGQLMLDTYATYDETGRTTEDEQIKRDGKLLMLMARMNGLDWSTLGADVAPEMVLEQALRPRLSTNQPDVTSPRLPAIPRNNRERRAVLEADMFGVRGHPTSPHESDERAYWDEDFSALADEDRAYGESERPGRNRAVMSQRSAPRSRAVPARMAPAALTLTIDDADEDAEALGGTPDNVILAPTPLEPDDSPQGRRILRYLDRHPEANNNQIAEALKRRGFKVSEKTVRAWHGRWYDRQIKRGVKAAPPTIETRIITPEMIAAAQAEKAEQEQAI